MDFSYLVLGDSLQQYYPATLFTAENLKIYYPLVSPENYGMLYYAIVPADEFSYSYTDQPVNSRGLFGPFTANDTFGFSIDYFNTRYSAFLETNWIANGYDTSDIPSLVSSIITKTNWGWLGSAYPANWWYKAVWENKLLILIAKTTIASQNYIFSFVYEGNIGESL